MCSSKIAYSIFPTGRLIRVPDQWPLDVTQCRISPKFSLCPRGQWHITCNVLTDPFLSCEPLHGSFPQILTSIQVEELQHVLQSNPTLSSQVFTPRAGQLYVDPMHLQLYQYLETVNLLKQWVDLYPPPMNTGRELDCSLYP